MSQTTILCDASRDGRPCGENAVIHSSQYIYDNMMYRPGTGGRFDPQLKEAHHQVECPKCGKRNQVVLLD